MRGPQGAGCLSGASRTRKQFAHMQITTATFSDQNTRSYGRKVLDKKCISRKKFIRLGAAVGLGSAAVPLVSACGGGGAAEVELGGGRSLNGGLEVDEGETIAAVSGVEPGSAVPFTNAGFGEQAVLLRLEDGEFAAHSAICTYMGCVVAYDRGESTLECPCHGSIFDPANGAEVLNGPATEAAPTTDIAGRLGVRPASSTGKKTPSPSPSMMPCAAALRITQHRERSRSPGGDGRPRPGRWRISPDKAFASPSVANLMGLGPSNISF